MRVQLSGKRFVFGRNCVCCGAPAETELAVSATRTTGKRVVRTRTNTWMFPYCQSCVAHVAAWDSAGGCGVIAFALIVGTVLSFWHLLVGVAVAGIGIALAVRDASKKRAAAKALCGPACTSAQRAVTYEGWSGTVETFEIASEQYAVQFMLGNRAKLINVSPETWSRLRAALDSGKVAPAAAPALQTRGNDSLLRWTAKVENAKGPATRRAAVESALRDSNLTRREEFIRAAARIELRATLDKVESLQTVAAKKRYISDALEALRADSAPDDLQAAELTLLEDELKSLT